MCNAMQHNKLLVVNANIDHHSGHSSQHSLSGHNKHPIAWPLKQAGRMRTKRLARCVHMINMAVKVDRREAREHSRRCFQFDIGNKKGPVFRTQLNPVKLNGTLVLHTITTLGLSRLMCFQLTLPWPGTRAIGENGRLRFNN